MDEPFRSDVRSAKMSQVAPIDRARRFVEQHHPDANCALLGGSSATGRSTPSSDLDIVVMYPDGAASYAETLTFEGQLVETFVHTPVTVDEWQQRDRKRRRPTLARLIASSSVLVGEQQAQAMRDQAAAYLSAGPPPLTQEEIDHLRYALSGDLDDLADTSDPAERFVVQAAVFRATAELVLDLEGRWRGGGKWLARELRDAQDPIAAELIAWTGSQESGDLIRIAGAALNRVGGYLQSGFVRGTKAERHDD